jgi:hypothetical protein
MNIINSNLDDEAKAIALSALVNSNTNVTWSLSRHVNHYGHQGRMLNPIQFNKVGVESARPDFKASMVSLVLEAIEALPYKARCKEIAEYANERHFNREDEISFLDVKAITTALVDCGILQREYKDEIITIPRREWVNDHYVEVSYPKVVQVAIFSFADGVELDV